MPLRPWTLSIETYGDIAAATIAPAPLTVFVGRNGTGKAAMARLVWALLHPDRAIFPDDNAFAEDRSADEPLEIWAGEIIAHASAGATADHVISEAMLGRLRGLINEVLAERKNDILRNLLGAGRTTVARLHLDWEKSAVPWTLLAMPPDSGAAMSPLAQLAWLHADHQMQIEIAGQAENTVDLRRWLIRAVCNFLISGSGGTQQQQNQTIYLPAGRVGLMVAATSVTALGAALDDHALGLPDPESCFLDAVVAPAVPSIEPLAEIGADLERDCLGGVILPPDANSPVACFRASGGSKPVPLVAAPARVAALAPFVLLLKSTGFGGIVVEEPEAHLDIATQRAFCKALGRVVKLGIPVLLTTHTATVLDAINRDCRDGELAPRVYEFTRGDAGVSVTALADHGEGFAAASLRDLA